MRRTRARGAAGAAVVLAVAAGFAFVAVGVDMPRISGIEELPLPGGADLGGQPVEITAEFRDVLSLVPQSAVKFNDVSVGRVAKVRLAEDGWTARVTMRVNGEVRLPEAPYARIEQSSLLGEKYVQLVAPPKRRPERTPAAFAEGAQEPGGGVDIPLSRTNRNPEVEEVLGALSMLLNGGGVSQLKTITKELNKALSGNEQEARSMLRRVEKLVKNLDGHRKDITDALDGVNRLSSTLSSRRKQIGTTLTGLSPGIEVLSKQRGQLMRMLGSLDDLSDVAVETVEKTKDDLVADLRALAPALRDLADAGRDLPDSLQVLFTYPFTDEVLRGVKGDYLNVYLDMTAVPGTQIVPPVEETPVPPVLTDPAAAASGALPPVALPPVADAGARKPANSAVESGSSRQPDDHTSQRRQKGEG
ncbi:MCE family protein [Streptomyces sulphureus]|uniref:MCE family protein n=1 Tax=Streptomyces sulphureus TaxID=47758 RepID=UPI000399FFF7|nr:MCE family protein [Streptomyces sulphureus]